MTTEMAGNPHYNTACLPVTLHHDSPEQELAALQLEATLALAFEQRTANLIAALGHFGKDLSDWDSRSAALWARTAKEIDARLGLI